MSVYVGSRPVHESFYLLSWTVEETFGPWKPYIFERWNGASVYCWRHGRM